MTTNSERLLRRLTVLFGAPDTIDLDAFLEEFRLVLKAASPEVLDGAGDIIRDTHTRRGWPSPAEVKHALAKAAARRQATRYSSVREPIAVKPTLTPEKRAELDGIVRAAIETLNQQENVTTRVGPRKARR
jgi:hypothetical protein